jgi:hypothetical protein
MSRLEDMKYEVALSFGIGADDKVRETLNALCEAHPEHTEALLSFAVDFAVGLLHPDPSDPEEVALANYLAKRFRERVGGKIR